MEIEIIQTKDAARLSKLNKEVQELHFRLYPEYFKPYNFEDVCLFFQKEISNPTFLFYIVVKGKEDIGYLWIEVKEYKENAFKKAYSSIYIHHLNVKEEYRNRGVGRALIEKVRSIAKTKEIHKIELDYWANNESAQKFYEKHGYKKYREFSFREI